MIRVVLLGDSIRQHYQPLVAQLLEETCTVWGPQENCAFAKWTLYALRFWREQLACADVIHWNNGLHDVVRFFQEDGCFVSLEEYRDSVLKIARELLKTGAKVIFATTTPILKDDHERANADIIRYNRAVVPLLEKMGVVIDDLHACISADPQKYISQDGTHMNDLGKTVCAQAVAASIRSVC